MKIYIDDVIKNITYDDITTRHLIYTTDGIYCNHKKKLTRLESSDSHKIVTKDKYSFLIDTSVETYGDTLFHIPYDHLCCEETYEKKNIGYDIFYVKYSYFDQVSYYFEVERLDDYIIDEIITFLCKD